MPTPFVLRTATRRTPEPLVPWTYDPGRQLNTTPDGEPTGDDWDLLLATSNTQSTAGSKTHNDDD